MTRKDAAGLWIPDRDNNKWTPSHPEKHTELFTGGTKSLRALRARVARLGKAWNKQFDEDDRALSSFNIVTLAWEYIDDSSVPLDQALAGWFRYSHDEIDKGETKDPAGVSDPIRLLLPKSLVLKRLGGAADRLEDALANEDDEDEVKDALSRLAFTQTTWTLRRVRSRRWQRRFAATRASARQRRAWPSAVAPRSRRCGPTGTAATRRRAAPSFPRQTGPWYGRDRDCLLFDGSARSFPGLRIQRAGRGRVYRVRLDVPHYESRNVEIRFADWSRTPNVFVDGPEA